MPKRVLCSQKKYLFRPWISVKKEKVSGTGEELWL
jgi:hypothetical protein